MPLRDDLLNPIPGENPSGQNLKYDPLYDKIKEARREDDDAPQGEWQRERKAADWGAVIKLASDALATRTKDLQLAAWIAEALLRKESFGGLLSGLNLIKGLLENFWDTIYPEVEDGDLELRAAPLEWIGTRFDDPLRKAPLAKAGYGFYKYKESRSIGYEEDAADNDAKREAREAAIQDGKLTAEDFDRAFAETAKDFYQRAVEHLDGCLESLESLRSLSDEKFGEFAPSFGKLREALQEVRHTANMLYQKKRELAGETDAPPPEPEEEPVETQTVESGSWTAAAAAPARAPARTAVVALEPADMEDAALRITAVARYLRSQDGYSPAPYLLVRGFRWGELRAGGPSPDASLFVPPSSEIRQQLKRAVMDGDWAAVLEMGESAMAQPCGRAWLDLQRYVVTAAEQYGYPQIAAAIASEIRALLNDIPGLRRMMLMDDTPTANQETQQWLDQIVASGRESGPAVEQEYSRSMVEEEPAPSDSEAAPPDSYDLALAAVRQGRTREAIEMLVMEAARQSSGRARFQRRLQLAELCLKAGEEPLAQPILEQLVAEIDAHNLETWESADVLAYPMAMLLKCLSKLDDNSAMKQQLYTRLCRLDPVQALNCKP